MTPMISMIHTAHSARRFRSMLLLAAMLGLSCGDDAPVVTSAGMDTELTTTGADTQASTGAPTTMADTTEGVDASGTSGSDSGTGEDTTGGEALPGQTVSQLVSSGTRASSRQYTVVHTLGQPSSLQSTHVSSNYRVQGGLIGANGSPP